LEHDEYEKNGFNPTYIIDAGAFIGDWTSNCRKIFPQSNILMIEGQESKKEILSKITNANTFLEINLIGSEEGKKVNFIHGGSNSNINQTVENQSYNRELTTIDAIAKKHDFPRIDLIKLDIQGYELEALKGAKLFLSNVEVILIEVSLIDIGNSGVPLFKDVMSFMHDNDFTIYDICSTRIRRPLDNALWQTDLVFVKNNSGLLKSKMYA